jgi:hypothetical protein
VSVHRSNTFRSVGDIEITPGFLTTMRKEGFARVHQPRKGEALRLLEGLREKPSERLKRVQGVHQGYSKFTLQL